MMKGAFPIGPNAGYEVYPDKLEIINTTKKGAYFAIHIEEGKTVVMLVTGDVAGQINLMEEREHDPTDTI